MKVEKTGPLRGPQGVTPAGRRTTDQSAAANLESVEDVTSVMGIPEGVDSYEGKMARYEPAWDTQYDIIRDIKKKMADKLK